MREGLGSIALYNIIIVFIFLTFAILAGTLSYSKAFKANNRIINAIEKYEGYNDSSADWINKYLSSIGYQYEEKAPECSVRRGLEPMQSLNDNYRFCVYAESVDTRTYNGRYVEFGVVTYIYIDMPVIGNFFRIPVYGKSNRVFCFGERCSSKMENVNDAS